MNRPHPQITPIIYARPRGDALRAPVVRVAIGFIGPTLPGRAGMLSQSHQVDEVGVGLPLARGCHVSVG